MEALLLFGMVLGLLFLGVPVGVSLGLSAILFVAFVSQDSLSSVAISLFGVGQHYTLLAIPFFVLASAFMATGGVAHRLIQFAIATVGHFRGGLAMASVLACMMFAALSGSSPATVVAIGSLAIAGMKQVGYTQSFAAGVIANAGTLGILIPPSIVMVVYAAATDVSVGRMFLAGIIPGLTAGGLLMLGIYVTARRKNLPAEPWRGWLHWMRAGKDAFWGLFLIIIILGGIYGGVFTPTEAAIVAAVYAMVISLFVYRELGPLKNEPWLRDSDSDDAKLGFRSTAYGVSAFWVFTILTFFAIGNSETGFTNGTWGRLFTVSIAIGALHLSWRAGSFTEAMSALSASVGIWLRNTGLLLRFFLPSMLGTESRETLLKGTRTTLMLMFIIANALLFAHTLSAERIPQAVTEWMIGIGFNAFTFLIAVNILLLIGGQFMEPSGLLVIVAPVVFPIAMALGIDPIHLGIIMVVNMEIGMITPPIGLNLFVTSGITGMSLQQVVKAALPFVAILLAFLIMVTYIPALSTAVPNALMGPEVVIQ